MFSITGHKGFQLTFANGWTVSVQWGPGNYSTGYPHNLSEFDAPKNSDNWRSETAEIAAWDKNGKWYNFPHDTVKGYVSANDVATFIAMIQQKR